MWLLTPVVWVADVRRASNEFHPMSQMRLVVFVDEFTLRAPLHGFLRKLSLVGPAEFGVGEWYVRSKEITPIRKTNTMKLPRALFCRNSSVNLVVCGDPPKLRQLIRTILDGRSPAFGRGSKAIQ